MHRDIMKSLVLLFVAGALVSAAVPAPRPWPATRRLPRGTFQSDRSAFQSALPTPADVTDRSPQRRAAGVRAQQRAATQPAVSRRPDRRAAEQATVDSRTLDAGSGPRTRRGKRSRRRGCRGGVRWRVPGERRADQLLIGQLNVQSLKPKLPDLRLELSTVTDYDILAISETWLTANVPTRLLTVSGYQLHRCDRPRTSRLAKGHGGVALLSRDSYDVTVLPTPAADNGSNLEALWTTVRTSRHRQLLVGSFYRHPTQTVHQISADLDDIEHQLQCMLARHSGIVVLCGDFNLNILDRSPGSAGSRFRQLLSAYGLNMCNETEPTYSPAKSLLDVIITNRQNIVKRSGVTKCHYSPHDFSRALLGISKANRKSLSVTSRCTDRIPYDEFNTTLLHYPWGEVFVQPSTQDKWECFLQKFVPQLDSVAPIRTVRLRNPEAPSVSADTARLMQQRRGALACADRGVYKALNSRVRAAIRRDSRDHIRQRMSEVGRSGMWRCLRQVIGTKVTASAAPEVDADTLNEYFVSVGTNTAASVVKPSVAAPVRLPRVMTCSFSLVPVTHEQLWYTVRRMKSSSSCGKDGVSVKLIQRCFRSIGHVLLDVVNSSLTTGHVPESWKHATVTPLPKTNVLNDPSKFRPISVVPAISKIVERVVYNQLNDYFTRHELYSRSQHGYRAHHSTETALTEVTDKIMCGMDRGEISLLVLIDLSRCFDVIDHGVLLDKLKLYNIDTTWFENYLRGHTQQVKARDSDGNVKFSTSMPITTGVYQGTSLGPLLFSVFSNDLALHSHGVSIFQYADDTQVLISGRKQDIHSLIYRMEQTLCALSKWFSTNSMKVNADKTQLMVFGTKAMLRNFPEVRLNFGGSVITESRTAKNLGLVMDRFLTFDSHIDQLVGKCTGMLLALSHAKHCLPADVIQPLVACLVMSHIRYCVSIYGTYGQAQKHRIQKLLNFCARVVCGVRKYDHISAKYKQLGWLNAEQLILYHRMCLIHRVRTTGAPAGIAEHLVTCDHQHSTRTRGLLQRPSVKTNAGARRLYFSGIDAYNKLPQDIREVRITRFKTRVTDWLLRDTG